MKNSNILKLRNDHQIDIWLDDFSMKMLEDGTLKNLINQGLSGMTTNPSIFYKAIKENISYKENLSLLKSVGLNNKAILLQTMCREVKKIADLFYNLYKNSKGNMGYVSIELDPNISHDSKKMEAEAEFLWETVERKNILIKIPATEEGIKAIENTIAKGISVNVTLIFSLKQYRSVINAYKQGLEKAQKNNIDITNIFSVASVFISRIDSMVDKLLNPPKEISGKVAVANTIILYNEYRKSFNEENWIKKLHKGRLQKILFASTGVKNPEYSTLKYIEELLYGNIVSTLPKKTLDALNEVQSIRAKGNLTFEEAYSNSLAILEKIELHDIYKKLLQEGEEIFIKAWNSTIQLIDNL